MDRTAALPKGYKQTEVGVIPDDWEAVRLGNIATIVTGSTPPVKDLSNYGDEYLFVSPTDLGRSKYVNNTEKMLSKKGFWISRPLPKGSVLFVCIGSTIGKCGIASLELTSNQQINTILPSTEASSEYIYYAVSLVASKVKSLAGQQAVPIVNKTQFSDTPVPIPPTKAEQKAIAEALSDADALIESLEQLISKKRLIKQGAMQELLTGKRRLPGFGGTWDHINLGELFAFKNGLNKGKIYFGFGTPIVNYMDVYTNSKIYSANLKGRVFLTSHELTNFDVRKGDVLFTRTSETPDEIGMAAVVLDEPSQAVFSGFVLRARPKNERLFDQFKAYCFQSEYVRSQIISKASYTTRALTNGRILSDVILPIPGEAEQLAIASILSDMDAEITSLETKLNKARQIKQGMMQELLTGKTRLI